MSFSKIMLIILLSFMMGLCIYKGFLNDFLSPIPALLFTLFLAIPSTLYIIFVHHTQSFTQKLSPFLGIFFIFFSTSILYLLILSLPNPYQTYFAIFSFCLATFLSIFAFYQNSLQPKTKYLHFKIPTLIQRLRTIQVTDLHLGGVFINQSSLQKLIETINQHNPDIIFLTGDIIDAPIPAIKAELEILKTLNAKIGIYYVLGNHEYFYNLDEIIQTLQSFGFITLLNQSLPIKQNNQAVLNIAGINDISNHHSIYKANLDETLAKLNLSLPTILLSHQPKIIHSLKPNQVFLILSGHTHGGQIFPFNWLVLLQQPFIKGLHQRKGIWIYISEGTGFWGIPMRLGSQAEITVIELLPTN